MRKAVTKLMIFNLYLYLILMIGVFSIKFDKQYLWGGGVILVAWCFIYLKTTSGLKRLFQLDPKTKRVAGTNPAHSGAQAVKKKFLDKIYGKSQAEDGDESREQHLVDNEEHHKLSAINESFGSADDCQQERYLKFKSKMEKISSFNDSALEHSYVHPFQKVNPRLYDGADS